MYRHPYRLEYSRSGSSSHPASHEGEMIALESLLPSDPKDKSHATGVEAHDRAQPPTPPHTSVLFWGCLSLHVVLVLLHVALLLIFLGGFEQQALVSQAAGPVVAVVIIVVEQIFITLYTVALVFCVQRLAFRRDLHLPQSLSALHDTTTAWNGLGSAILSLIRQYTVRTTITGVLHVVLYLGAISIQHITTPALFSLTARNIPVSVPVTTTPSRPALTYPWSDYNALFVDSMLSLSGSAYDLPSYQLGLEGNILYDVLADNTGVGAAQVAASQIGVQCGLLATNTTAVPNTTALLQGPGYYTWDVDTDAGLLEVVPGWAGTIYLRPIPDNTSTSVLVIAYINVTDTSGAAPQSVNLFVNGHDSDAGGYLGVDRNRTVIFQIAACNLAVVNQSVAVDSQNKTLLGSPPRQQASSWWEPWNSTQSLVTENSDPLVLAWSTLVFQTASAASSQLTSFALEGDSPTLSYLELALIESLSIMSASSVDSFTIVNESTPGMNISLLDLEMALENLTATMYWYSTRAAESIQAPPGEAHVQVNTTFYQLRLSGPAIYVGLVASLVLLSLSVSLTLQPGHMNHIPEELHQAGFLNALWLSGRSPSVARRIFEYVPRPSVHTLRAVGVLELQLGTTSEPAQAIQELIPGSKAVAVVRDYYRDPSDSTKADSESAYAMTPLLVSGPETEREEVRPSPSRRHSRSAVFAVCLALHAALVLAHIILVVVYAYHYERNATFSGPGAVSTYIVVAAQCVATLITTGLTFVTQQLALRRNLHIPQTLAVLHDKTSAWSGLGSALSVLRQQLDLATSVSGVLSIFLYLTCLSVHHVTMPALFTVVASDTTSAAVVATRPSRPALTITGDSLALTGYFQESMQALQSFQLDRDSSRLGLQGNILYDVIDDNSGLGTALVNSTTFHVTCCLLDPAPQPMGDRGYSTDFGVVSAPLAFPNTLLLPVTQLEIPPLPSVVMVAAYTNITDTVGQTPPSTSVLDPTSNVTSYLQVAPCSLETRNGSVEVDVRSKMILDSPPRTNMSIWEACSPEVVLPNQTDPLSQAWPNMIGWAGDAYGQTQYSDPGSFLNDVEQFVSTELGLTPDANLSFALRRNISLGELEMALENVTATLYWYLYFIMNNGTSQSTDETVVELQSVLYHLNLNAVPLAFGLGSSLALLILAIILAVPPKRDGLNEGLGGAGLLQILWLSGRTPSVAQRISERVRQPSTQALRVAGMQESQLGFTWM